MKTFLIKLIKKGKIRLIEPSNNIKKSYMEKSESNLISSKILLKNDRLEESVSLTYYSMYNLVLALLFSVGIKCENHSAVAIMLKKVFDLDNSILIQAKKERIDKQYYTDFHITAIEVEEGIVSAENFNRNLRAFILNLNNQRIDVYREKFEEITKWEEK